MSAPSSAHALGSRLHPVPDVNHIELTGFLDRPGNSSLAGYVKGLHAVSSPRFCPQSHARGGTVDAGSSSIVSFGQGEKG